jgi:predicted PurR-regulated permease PerM
MSRQGSPVPSWYATLASYAGRFLLIVAAGYVVLYLVVRLRVVFLPIFVALVIASVLVTPVRWLTEKGWKPLLATWTVLLLTSLMIVGIFTLIVPAFVTQVDNLGQRIEQGADRLLQWLVAGPLGLSERQIDDYIQRAGEQIRQNSSVITGGVLSGVLNTVEFLAGAILMLVLLFFFLKDGESIGGWVLRQFSDRTKPHMREMGHRAFATLAAYARGTSIIALVDAVLIGVALVIVGNPLAFPLGVITFFASFFPIVGAVAAGAIAALVTLVSNGLPKALIITGVIVAIQQIEGDVLQPVVMGRLVRLHPVAILLALTSGGILAGIAGAFVAVPIAAVVSNVGHYLKTLDQN